MNRKRSGPMLVAMLAMLLSFGDRAPSLPRHTASTGPQWLNPSVAWIIDVLVGGHGRRPASRGPTALGMQTGACLDPNGQPIPNKPLPCSP